jgi:uncharacterized membrane protein YjjB (DUF3815 family)
MQLLYAVLQGFFGAGFASFGFAVLFNIRGRSVFFAAVCGGIGGLVYNLCVYFGMNAVLANFVAAVAIGICGEIFARWLKTTVTTFVACGLIPLVPGGDCYRMMVYFLKGSIYPGLQEGLTAVTIAGMLSIGLMAVTTITHFLSYTKEEIKKKHLAREMAQSVKSDLKESLSAFPDLSQKEKETENTQKSNIETENKEQETDRQKADLSTLPAHTAHEKKPAALRISKRERSRQYLARKTQNAKAQLKTPSADYLFRDLEDFRDDLKEDFEKELRRQEDAKVDYSKYVIPTALPASIKEQEQRERKELEKQEEQEGGQTEK